MINLADLWDYMIQDMQVTDIWINKEVKEASCSSISHQCARYFIHIDDKVHTIHVQRNTNWYDGYEDAAVLQKIDGDITMLFGERRLERMAQELDRQS